MRTLLASALLSGLILSAASGAAVDPINYCYMANLTAAPNQVSFRSDGTVLAAGFDGYNTVIQSVLVWDVDAIALEPGEKVELVVVVGDRDPEGAFGDPITVVTWANDGPTIDSVTYFAGRTLDIVGDYDELGDPIGERTIPGDLQGTIAFASDTDELRLDLTDLVSAYQLAGDRYLGVKLGLGEGWSLDEQALYTFTAPPTASGAALMSLAAVSGDVFDPSAAHVRLEVVPEPASLALLGAGGTLLLMRRRN